MAFCLVRDSIDLLHNNILVNFSKFRLQKVLRNLAYLSQYAVVPHHLFRSKFRKITSKAYCAKGLMKIEKKIWPIYFEKIASGDKTFELRLADWACNPGDSLLLREWDPNTKRYTGREIEKEVAYVLKTKDVTLWSQEDVDTYGFQIISIKDIKEK